MPWHKGSRLKINLEARCDRRTKLVRTCQFIKFTPVLLRRFWSTSRTFANLHSSRPFGIKHFPEGNHRTPHPRQSARGKRFYWRTPGSLSIRHGLSAPTSRHCERNAVCASYDAWAAGISGALGRVGPYLREESPGFGTGVILCAKNASCVPCVSGMESPLFV